MKTVGFHTFGCKLNFSETSSISREFSDNGFKKKSIYDNPNKVIINTCSVTENADKKCQDLIRKIKRKSPDSEITVVGCFAQLKPEEIINIKGVDKVIGAKNKFNFQSYISDKSVIHSKINESKDFKSTLSINYEHDPNLIAGLIIQVGSVMVDTSIKTKLKKLEKNMLET